MRLTDQSVTQGLASAFERIEAVVLRGDEHHVVLRAVHRQIGDPERLPIDGNHPTVHEKSLPKARGIHVGWSQGVLLTVGTGPILIVVIGVNTRQSGDRPRLRCSTAPGWRGSSR